MRRGFCIQTNNNTQQISSCVQERPKCLRNLLRHTPFLFSTFFCAGFSGFSGLCFGFSGLDLTKKELFNLCTFSFHFALLFKFMFILRQCLLPSSLLTLLWISPLTDGLSSLSAPSPFFPFALSLSLFSLYYGYLASWVVSLPFDTETC